MEREIKQREFKFRAWNGENMIEWEKLMSLRYAIQKDDITVLQYTGLKVKDVELFEGDVLEYQIDGSIYTCEWHPDICAFFLLAKNNELDEVGFDQVDLANDFKIIGNIFEHPNLIP